MVMKVMETTSSQRSINGEREGEERMVGICSKVIGQSSLSQGSTSWFAYVSLILHVEFVSWLI